MSNDDSELASSAAPSAAVLCLAFNRPDCFARTLEALKAAGPREYFIAVDGPRTHRPADAVACAEVRRLAQSVDWATCLELKLEERNLGCGPAISAAISWVLSKVPEVIIIEDDCLPDPSFLRLCDELLARYRDDTRVMQIGGSNWGAAPDRFAGHSYAFTSFAPVWGWATWRRAWELYDFALDSWPRFKSSGLAEGMSVSPRFRRMLEQDWENVLAGRGTWDHQWQYAVLRHHGLSVCPARNLVQNIGLAEGGTQLQSADRILSRVPLQQLDFPLSHPPEVARSASVESVFEQVYWQKFGWPARIYRSLVRMPVMGPLLRDVARAVVRRPT